MEKMIEIDGYSLDIQDVNAIAFEFAKVKIQPQVLPKLIKSREIIQDYLESGETVYGVNTGFGFLKNTRINQKDIETLQRNLILSHAGGVGEPFEIGIVRMIMLLRVNALIQGNSGIRPEVIDTIIEFLNKGIHPYIPSQGSVGSSGDLAPLSHLALCLMGEGQILLQDNTTIPTKEVLEKHQIKPVTLLAKEGLALINGTQPMCALACYVAQKMSQLLDLADMAACLTIQATLGTNTAFRHELHLLRPHPGQLHSATQMWNWLLNSEIINSHQDQQCNLVQDAYSLRCTPQVHGASRDAYSYLRQVLKTEINSVTDNPLVLPESREILSCGHFHGQPIALAMDFIKIALAELGNISERRVERLVNPQLSNGLPAFLTPKSGLNSGYMIAQYIAASLVSENKVLCHPASVDSIPTSANQEDHVSMGTIAANQAKKIVNHLEYILAIEFLCACQALEFRRPLKPSPITHQVYRYFRENIPALDNDRFLKEDIERAFHLISSGKLFNKIQDFNMSAEDGT